MAAIDRKVFGFGLNLRAPVAAHRSMLEFRSMIFSFPLADAVVLDDLKGAFVQQARGIVRGALAQRTASLLSSRRYAQSHSYEALPTH